MATITLEIPRLNIHWEDLNNLESASPKEKEQLEAALQTSLPKLTDDQISHMKVLHVSEELRRTMRETIAKTGSKGITAAVNEHFASRNSPANVSHKDMQTILKYDQEDVGTNAPSALDDAYLLATIFSRSLKGTQARVIVNNETKECYVAITQEASSKMYPHQALSGM